TYSDSTTQNLTSSVTWSSSAPAVATISTTGLATAVGPGGTTIQAVSGAISGSTGLTVSSALPGLVGHWTFDEGTGSAAADSSGSGYNASLFNGVSWVTGKLGDAISANGSNQYASMPSINLSATSAATVAMWVNRTYTNGADVLFEFSTNYNSNNNVFAFFPDEAADCGNGSMEIAIHGNAGYNVKCYAQPTSGVWHHLAIVYDMSQTAASEISLYIDGVLQAAQKQPYSSNNTGSFGSYPFYLFSRAGSIGFAAGEIDDLQLYNRALSAAEIQQIY
ncbi:MAG: LamG-like jellyroll fold domain-containing protein, partial [Candidatus Acidiferrales bacterium]